jgi:hypothetical protein
MYSLVFNTHTIKLNSLDQWHSKVSKLQAQGINYKSFEKDYIGWRFYY